MRKDRFDNTEEFMRDNVVKIAVIVLSCAVIILLASCNRSDIREVKQRTRFVTADSSVVSVKEINYIESKDKAVEDIGVDVKERTAYELKITEEGNATTAEEGDVTYEGVTYRNIYKEIEKVGKPCSTKGLVKFITENFNAKQNEVFVRAEEITDDSNIYTELQSMINYTYIENKYNCKPAYMVTVYEYGMSRYVTIYTCDKYMILVNTGSDIEIKYTWEGEDSNEDTEEDTGEYKHSSDVVDDRM